MMDTQQEIVQVQNAMDNLALALVGHKHKWTRKQRHDYEKAQRTLGAVALHKFGQ